MIVIKYMIIVSLLPGKYELDATGKAQHTASQRTPDTPAEQHCHFSGHTAKESKVLRMNIATITLTRKLDISMLRSTFKSIAAEDSFHLTWT